MNSTIFSAIFACCIVGIFGKRIETCPSGYDDGRRVNIGRYWYDCVNGNLLPKGCLADDDARINAFESYRSNSYSITCLYDTDGRLTLSYKACIIENEEYYPGQSYKDEQYVYTCVKKDKALKVEITGCIFEEHKYKIGDSTVHDGFVYECSRSSAKSCSMCPVGCANGNGQRFMVGETFTVDDFAFACTEESGRVVKKVVGCVHLGKTLNAGQRYVVDKTVFECHINNDTAPEHRLMGCADYEGGSLIERRLDCEWVSGSSPYQYVKRCSMDPSGIKAVTADIVRCNYGGVELRPGCFKSVGNGQLIAACSKGTDGQPQLYTLPAQHLNRLYSDGLQLCK